MPLETSESSADEEDFQPNVIKNTALHEESKEEEEGPEMPLSIEEAEDEGQIQPIPEYQSSNHTPV